MDDEIAPENAFAGRFAVFENVLVTPHRRGPDGRSLRGGILLPPGAPDWAHHMRRGNRSAQEPEPPEDAHPEAETLPGTFVYGGVKHFHFGHFTAEYLHRLWVTERPEFADAPVVFVAQAYHPKQSGFFDGWLDVLRIGRRLVVDRPVRLERLVIAEQAKQWQMRPAPTYQDFLDRRLGYLRADRPRHPAKLAVLRPHLHDGRVLGEAWLEARLVEQGFVPFRPEQHSVREQLEHYLDARMIVFSEGSAIHPFDLMPRTGAAIAVINRRDPSTLARTSLHGKGGQVHVFTPVTVLGHAIPGKNALKGGLSLVDMKAVTAFLRRHGFMTQDAGDFFADTDAVLEDVLSYMVFHRRAEPGKAMQDPRLLRETIAFLARGLGLLSAEQTGAKPEGRERSQAKADEERAPRRGLPEADRGPRRGPTAEERDARRAAVRLARRRSAE